MFLMLHSVFLRYLSHYKNFYIVIYLLMSLCNDVEWFFYSKVIHGS